jgi:hypothetical protein
MTTMSPSDTLHVLPTLPSPGQAATITAMYEYTVDDTSAWMSSDDVASLSGTGLKGMGRTMSLLKDLAIVEQEHRRAVHKPNGAREQSLWRLTPKGRRVAANLLWLIKAMRSPADVD